MLVQNVWRLYYFSTSTIIREKYAWFVITMIRAALPVMKREADLFKIQNLAGFPLCDAYYTGLHIGTFVIHPTELLPRTLDLSHLNVQQGESFNSTTHLNVRFHKRQVILTFTVNFKPSQNVELE